MIPHSCTGPNCFGCKVKSIQIQSGPVFRPHYNWSVGAYVNTDSEYRDQLKYAADRNSEATGLDHEYEPRYPGDTQPIRSADQALEDHARSLRDPTNV